jgi:hypothetical protein
MNEFQKRVIARLMRRILNQIPAYRKGSKKPEKDHEIQKQNLTQLLYQRSIKNASFISATGGDEAQNDVQFVDNIFKYIQEYDHFVKNLKKPKIMAEEFKQG